MKHDLMQSLVMSLSTYGEGHQHPTYGVKRNGLTGKQWNRRKSRSKLAKQSRKKNRGY